MVSQVVKDTCGKNRSFKISLTLSTDAADAVSPGLLCILSSFNDVDFVSCCDEETVFLGMYGMKRMTRIMLKNEQEAANNADFCSLCSKIKYTLCNCIL